MYDYALITEPLATAELASIGWRNRQSLADAGNQFHYYRLTADNRILWGGYDAVYYNGGRISAARDVNPATFARLAGLTRASTARADRGDGRRGLWLRTLDRLGVGTTPEPGGAGSAVTGR